MPRRFRIRAEDWIPVEEAGLKPGDVVLWCNSYRAMACMDWKPILADPSLKYPATHVIRIELPHPAVMADPTRNDQAFLSDVVRAVKRLKAKRRGKRPAT